MNTWTVELGGTGVEVEVQAPSKFRAEQAARKLLKDTLSPVTKLKLSNPPVYTPRNRD